MRGLRTLLLAAVCGVAALAGCSAVKREPIKPMAHIDLPQFMGKWYVIAAIPTFIESDSYNAVESYTLSPDGKIETTYRQRKGSFDGKVKVMHPTGTVVPNTGNAVWGMQFVWPIKAEYIITFLSDNGQQTIVARNKRDYVWIMARTPTLPDEEFQALVARVKAMDYDTTHLRKVPQRWPESP
jgi:apolipoprotein D and lipocalin family protein